MTRWTKSDLDKAVDRLGRKIKAEKVSFGMAPQERGKNKFNAKKTELDGIEFDSRHEAEVYQGLKLRQHAGEISGLQCHVPIQVQVSGTHVFTYVCDFVFLERIRGFHTYQDAKGYKKGAVYQLFRLKKAVIKAAMGIEIEEV